MVFYQKASVQLLVPLPVYIQSVTGIATLKSQYIFRMHEPRFESVFDVGHLWVAHYARIWQEIRALRHPIKRLGCWQIFKSAHEKSLGQGVTRREILRSALAVPARLEQKA
jgi:hypothetical protein